MKHSVERGDRWTWRSGLTLTCSAEVCFLGRYVSQDCEWEDSEIQVEGDRDCNVAGGERDKLKTPVLFAPISIQASPISYVGQSFR